MPSTKKATRMKAKGISKFAKAGYKAQDRLRLKLKLPKNMGPSNSNSVSDGVNMEHFRQYEIAMRERIDEGKLPGYCSAMLRYGKVLHSDAYGYADRERGLKYGPDTICRLFCMTKPFVAAAILRLQEQGKLSVHDSIARYIPAFKSLRVVTSANAVSKSETAEHKCTILHCLTHTSGLGYSSGWNAKCEGAEEKAYESLNHRCERGEIKDLKEFIDEIAALPLRREPGTSFCYSFSLDVLGRIVEVVSGKSLGRYLQDHIFGPLKMKDTGFSFPNSKAGRVAALYCSPGTAKRLGEDKAKLPRDKQALCKVDGKRPTASRWHESKVCPIQSGGGFIGFNMGGLVSTLNDCAKFFATISNGGGRILKESTLNRYVWRDLLPEMCVNKQHGCHRGFSMSLGYSALGEVGLKKTAREAKKKSHMYDYDVDEVGCGGAACTYYSLDPRRKTVTLWFTQSLDNETFTKGTQSLWHVNRKAVPLLPSYRAPVSTSVKRTAAKAHQAARTAASSRKRQRTV